MELVFATHNPHKLKEVQLMLPDHIRLISLDQIGCADQIAETAETLEGNAIIKANHVFENYGYPCFADDTGLIVEALGGAPGVRSARYAGAGQPAEAHMDKLLKELAGSNSRNARFQTVIALQLDGSPLLFKGSVNGIITMAPKGNAGFGYDPVFQPEGYEQTFAQMPISLKNSISHRYMAFRQLTNFLRHLS